MAPRRRSRQLQLEIPRARWVQKRGRSGSFRVAGWSSEHGQDKGKPELRRDGRIDAGDASRSRDREADSGFSDAVRRQRLDPGGMAGAQAAPWCLRRSEGMAGTAWFDGAQWTPK